MSRDVSEPPPESSGAARIVAYARRHFFVHGFRNVTMDDLAAELGMSKKTLYTHFASKTALVEAVIQDKFRAVSADLEEIHPGAAPGFAKVLQRLLETSQRHLDEIQPPFVRDIQREAPELFRLIQSLRQRHIERHFGKLFEEGRRAGLIRKDVPPEAMIEILRGAVDGLITPDKIERLRLTPKTAFMAIVRVVLEGVLTEKGRE